LVFALVAARTENDEQVEVVLVGTDNAMIHVLDLQVGTRLRKRLQRCDARRLEPDRAPQGQVVQSTILRRSKARLCGPSVVPTDPH
jgi:hypothetical protein